MELQNKYDFEKNDNVEIVIGVNYEEIKGKKGAGDMRVIGPEKEDVLKVADDSIN